MTRACDQEESDFGANHLLRASMIVMKQIGGYNSNEFNVLSRGECHDGSSLPDWKF